MNAVTRPALAFGLAALLALPAPAQQPPDVTVDEAERAEVIDKALAALDRSYVFPELAPRMAQHVRAREKAGEYAALTGGREFARALTAHLQEVSRDKHLRVIVGDEGSFRARTQPADGKHGIEKVERLPGNVGYLELRGFHGTTPEASAAMSAAMSSLADADVLIFDLRRNGGGSPQMVALVSSYLFDRPVHLNSLYWRERDRTDEFWTTREVAGSRFGERKPVYVLTSKRTFSGAEEFSYNLKALKRATLVGETTGGGAHPGALRRLNDRFAIFVPTGRAINPITKGNWEGTGVAPDVEVAADQALEKALELAGKLRREGATTS
jgi:C-terminal processing protease CtpA/Prc